MSGNPQQRPRQPPSLQASGGRRARRRAHEGARPDDPAVAATARAPASDVSTKLLAEPKSLAEARDPSRRESLIGLCIERAPARVIAGGSDAEGWDQAGGVSSGPPVKSSALDEDQVGRRRLEPQ